MKLLIPALLILSSLISCINKEDKDTSAQDTTEIFETLLTSKNFMSEVYRETDTVFFLKNKYYNKAFPDRVNQIFVEYIENTEAARKMNLPSFYGNTRFWPKKVTDTLTKKYIEFLKKKSALTHTYDKRERFGIPLFFKKNDSARVTIHNYNSPMDLQYKLVKKDKKWIIIEDRMLIY